MDVEPLNHASWLDAWGTIHGPVIVIYMFWNQSHWRSSKELEKCQHMLNSLEVGGNYTGCLWLLTGFNCNSKLHFLTEYSLVSLMQEMYMYNSIEKFK